MFKLITSLPGYRHTPGYNFRGEIERYHDIREGEVIHGHERFRPQLADIIKSFQIRVVQMQRDPRDQVVSHMFHVRRDPTNPWHERFKELPDDDALMACIEGDPGTNRNPFLGGVQWWLKHSRSWSTDEVELIRVRYEDLKQEPQIQLERVFRFLGLEIAPSFVHSIVQRNRFERLSVGRKVWRKPRRPGESDPKSHFRSGLVGEWRDFFSDHHVRRFKELAGEDLLQLGYEADMNW
jgi:hypothetical protein